VVAAGADILCYVSKGDRVPNKCYPCKEISIFDAPTNKYVFCFFFASTFSLTFGFHFLFCRSVKVGL
jgi:hypothetical protein